MTVEQRHDEVIGHHVVLADAQVDIEGAERDLLPAPACHLEPGVALFAGTPGHRAAYRAEAQFRAVEAAADIGEARVDLDRRAIAHTRTRAEMAGKHQIVGTLRHQQGREELRSNMGEVGIDQFDFGVDNLRGIAEADIDIARTRFDARQLQHGFTQVQAFALPVTVEPELCAILEIDRVHVDFAGLPVEFGREIPARTTLTGIYLEGEHDVLARLQRIAAGEAAFAHAALHLGAQTVFCRYQAQLGLHHAVRRPGRQRRHIGRERRNRHIAEFGLHALPFVATHRDARLVPGFLRRQSETAAAGVELNRFDVQRDIDAARLHATASAGDAPLAQREFATTDVEITPLLATGVEFGKADRAAAGARRALQLNVQCLEADVAISTCGHAEGRHLVRTDLRDGQCQQRDPRRQAAQKALPTRHAQAGKTPDDR